MKFVCQGRRSGNYKNWFEEMKSTKKHGIIMERRQQQNRKERDRVQLACKGYGIIDKALKKGYNQT